VAKLSEELRKEKLEVEKAKADAAREMKRSEKVDVETGFTNKLSKKQIEVKKSASRHVAKAKQRVAQGYEKMKSAETNAAQKVHQYEHIKSGLMTAESSEMHSKQIEQQKMRSLAKAKRIEVRQERNLKVARETAAKETRNALYVAFGKEGLTNAITSPLRKELATALAQEKTQAKQIAHLQTLETKGFKAEEQVVGREVGGGPSCSKSGDLAVEYENCVSSCTAQGEAWYGAAKSCSCFKCRHILKNAMLAACSCPPVSASYQRRCPDLKTSYKTCSGTCIDESKKCSCGHAPASCCEAHNIDCGSGFLWDKKCLLGHPYGYVCELSMTNTTLFLVILAAFVLSVAMWGCIPSVLAWYCCIRTGSQLSWMGAGRQMYSNKGDDL